MQEFFNAVVEFFNAYGQIGLFFYSIVETITPLAGVEIFFLLLIETGGSWFNSWWFTALNTTIANAVGSAFVYLFMAKENNWIARKFISVENRKKAEAIFKRYGHWAIFIFAMTPLPYFVIVFVASFAKMNFRDLILSTVFSRGLRFFITTFIINYFSGVNTLQLVLILLGISLPIMGIMYIAEKRVTKNLNIEEEDKK
jgi:membrane protein YqaA with SNARE-associated domain